MKVLPKAVLAIDQDGISESWLPVVGFPGYEVSSYGRLRSLLIPGRANGRLSSVPRQRTLRHNSKGYCTINMRRDGKACSRLVHRLVLEAFVGPCPEGMECRHFPDNNRTNNNLNNLSWSTHQQNIDDTETHQTRARGGRGNARTKLDPDKVREIRAATDRIAACAKQYGVSKVTIQKIRNGKSWRHVELVATAVLG